MGTGYADYIRHIFRRVKILKSYSVYELVGVENGKPQLPRTVRIERYKGRSDARGINWYFRIKDTTNWNTSRQVTGLRPAGPNVFYGDMPKPDKTGPESLLLFQRAADGELLVIDYFRKYYPFVEGQRINMIRQHKYKY